MGSHGCARAHTAEYHFQCLREDAEAVAEVASAWRMAGGSFYKVRLSRRVICDYSHACS